MAKCDNPFPGLKIDSSEFLDGIQGRSPCPKCLRSRKYFCYTCYVPLTGVEGKLPHVKLPIKVDIIKHPGELDGKSTVAHAALLAPDDVTVYTYPSVPEYTDKDKVVLLFPCGQSLTMEEFARKCHGLVAEKPTGESTNENVDVVPSQTGRTQDSGSGEPTVKCAEETGQRASPAPEVSSESQSRNLSEDTKTSEAETPPSTSKRKSDLGEEEQVQLSKKARHAVQGLERVIFIDGTWSQVRKICMDDRLKDLTKVELKSQTTKFWRPQTNKPDTYLATIEAIYYFLREYHISFIDSDYAGQYDNLLFLFSYIYRKVHQGEGVEAKVARGKVKV